MINEILEVQAYLRGENIYKNECTFRMCILLAKHFHSLGFSPIEIREAIFKWGNDNGIYIQHNVNDLIKIAINDSVPLCDKDVYISDYDIKEIKRHVDAKNVKLCALALLAYAKAHADEDGEFNFSQSDFGKWIGIQQPHVSKYLEELETFDYIEKIRPMGDQIFAWNGRIVGKKMTYKIKVAYENSGEYLIKNNDIRQAYREFFEKR